MERLYAIMVRNNLSVVKNMLSRIKLIEEYHKGHPWENKIAFGHSESVANECE